MVLPRTAERLDDLVDSLLKKAGETLVGRTKEYNVDRPLCGKEGCPSLRGLVDLLSEGKKPDPRSSCRVCRAAHKQLVAFMDALEKRQTKGA